ncbi:MAG TPA: efflux transporter outer membrane subunit [Acidobacteriaceae bacterium]|nr:efflux transporter outer membrane subunit [Acidobacteriaceae bacterium]
MRTFRHLDTFRHQPFSRCSVKTLLGWATAVTLAAILGYALTGCTVGPKYHPPVVQAPTAYKESPGTSQSTAQNAGTWTVAQPQDAMLRGNWWEIFHDPELNALEEQLNINNQNIKQYFENFMEARAEIREARSQYFPTVSTSPSWQRSRSSGNLKNAATTTGSGGVTTNAGQQSSIYSLPLDISWAPDLWGKVRNEVHEYQYAAQMSAADLENERLTEQVSLAEYFFEIRGQDALVKLYADTVEADKKALELAQARYDTGVDDKLSVVEAQSTLQSAQSEAINLGILRAQYEHAIAVLVGKQASNFSIPVRPITTAPPPIPIGMPSELLQRRPDVAAAERNMAAANAQVGIAYAAYYPTLTLSAGGGYESSAFKHLFDWPSRFWSIGPSVSETIYDGGLRRATVHQYIAVYNADLASYRQTVLTAFQQVEDSLADVRLLSQQIQQQRQAVTSAQTALNLEMARYKTGIDPYLDVVTLQTTLLGDQQDLANLQIEQMTGAVELVGALGGGWDISQLPTPSQVTQKPTVAETKIQQ